MKILTPCFFLFPGIVLGQGIQNIGGKIALGDGAYLKTTQIIIDSSSVAGTIDNSGTIILTGDWTNNSTNGVFTTNAGIVEFSGGSQQTIAGSSATNFFNLVINNGTDGGGVTLGISTSVSGALTLTDGVVSTSSSNMLTINDAATSSQGSSHSYVDGPMRKTGSTAFVFPLGDGSTYARLGIGAPTSSSTFEAEYVHEAYSNTSSMAPSPSPALNNVSTKEYWDLSRIAGTGDAAVTLYWENAGASGIDDCLDLRVAHWNGLAWENNHEGNTGTSGSCSDTRSGTIFTTNNHTSFSPFTFGSISNGSNVLPITLLTFAATLVGDKVVLEWSTLSEKDNDYFTIEKTQDGTNYSHVAFLNAKGNSSSLQQYVITDENPFIGFSYYRLKQTDYDGHFTFSNLAPVEHYKETIMSIYPNPVTDAILNISTAGEVACKCEVKLINTIGKTIFTTPLELQQGISFYPLQLPNLPPGIYHLTVGNKYSVFQEKVIIQ